MADDVPSAQALLDRILRRTAPEDGEPLADDLAALVVRRTV
jgi:hypothetical protein